LRCTRKSYSIDLLQEGLNSWINHPPYLVILTTGMGLDALFEKADNMGVADRFLEVLSGSLIAARGYKTVNALKKRGLTPEIRDDDGSTIGLIRGLQSFDLKGKEVVLQLHGDPAPRTISWLEEAGAKTRQVLPYRHTPPEPSQLERLLLEITEGNM